MATKITTTYFDKEGAEIPDRKDVIEVRLVPNVMDAIEHLSFNLDKYKSTPKGWGSAHILIERIEEGE